MRWWLIKRSIVDSIVVRLKVKEIYGHVTQHQDNVLSECFTIKKHCIWLNKVIYLSVEESVVTKSLQEPDPLFPPEAMAQYTFIQCSQWLCNCELWFPLILIYISFMVTEISLFIFNNHVYFFLVKRQYNVVVKNVYNVWNDILVPH